MAELLQTESAERSTALVGTQMRNIAVNSRSYLDLVKLVPGVVSTVDLRIAGTGKAPLTPRRSTSGRTVLLANEPPSLCR